MTLDSPLSTLFTEVILTLEASLLSLVVFVLFFAARALEVSFDGFLSLLKIIFATFSFGTILLTVFVVFFVDLIFSGLAITLVLEDAFELFASFLVVESFDYFESALLLTLVFSYFFSDLDFFTVDLVF